MIRRPPRSTRADTLFPDTTRFRSALRHVTLRQGTKAYGVHLHPIRTPAREREPRDDHPNSYWFQEDYIREKAVQSGFGWTIFRPSIVLGPNVGVAMNTIPVIGRSEEHTSELQSLMRISYAVFCLKKKKKIISTKH